MSKIKEFYHDEIEKNMREFSDDDYFYEKYVKEINCNGDEITDCCGKSFVEETDFCTSCRNHAETKCVSCKTPCSKFKLKNE